MSQYSRTAKYAELRNQIQNETEPDVKVNDFSRIASRLSRSEQPRNVQPQAMEHDPIHARREESYSAKPKAQQSLPSFSDEHLSGFDNEYLDEYINEVKQYNIEQGMAVSTDTQSNILKELMGEVSEPSSRPYPYQPNRQVDLTADIPFMKSNHRIEDPELEQTKRDIASEVKNMVASGDTFDLPMMGNVVDNNEEMFNTLQGQLQVEKAAREKLSDETTQMRTQLDEYEDNLSGVNDKIQNTNRILNFILIVVILALLVVLGIVCYWIMLTKGVI